MKIERLFQCAKNMAEMSDFDKQQLGCVVTYKRSIIGMGFNTTKTHPVQKEYNKFRYECDYTPHSMHAEIHALVPIRHLDIDWSKVRVYIYRKARNGQEAALARPCPACMAYMKSLGIRNVYYTTPEGYAHEVLELDIK